MNAAANSPRVPPPSHYENLLRRFTFVLAVAVLVRFVAGCAAPAGPHVAIHVAPVAEAAAEPVFVNAPIDTRAIVILVHGFQRVCLGAAVGPKHIYTAAHCLRPGLGFVPSTTWLARGGVASPGAVVPLTPLFSDAGIDRAFLEHDGPPLEAWLDIAPVPRDAWVWATVYREAPARFERLLDTSGEPGYFAAARIEHGDSGGPVITADGAFVGIVTHCRNNIDQTYACNGGGLWRPFGVVY